MTRMTARQIAVSLVFSMEANRISAEEAIQMFFDPAHYESLRDEDGMFHEEPDEAQLAYIAELTGNVEAHLAELDAVIERYSDAWKKERLTKTTLAILRCALAEVCYMQDIPVSAAVNEAVELGKKYDSPKAAAFINGVLGSFLRKEKQDGDDGQ